MTRVPRQLWTLAACGLAGLLLGACTQQLPGGASPTASSSPTSSGEAGAPKVSNPKNLKTRDACQLLTADQLSALGATAAPKTGKSPWGENECAWINEDISVHLTPDTTQGRGLSTIYSNMSGAQNFLPLTIDGYPAARTDKQSLSCAIYVGTSDTQDFLVDFTRLSGTRPDYMDPCGFAQKIASDVLANLPAGQ